MASKDELIFNGMSELLGYPSRSEHMNIVKQGPVRRITLWKEIIDHPGVDDSVKAHYYEDNGLLVIDLHNGDSNDS